MLKKVTYDPLWKTLRARNMNKGDLQAAAHLSRGTITKIGKDESVTHLCNLKNCHSSRYQ